MYFIIFRWFPWLAVLSDVHQLTLILQTLGYPNEADKSWIINEKVSLQFFGKLINPTVPKHIVFQNCVSCSFVECSCVVSTSSLRSGTGLCRDRFAKDSVFRMIKIFGISYDSVFRMIKVNWMKSRLWVPFFCLVRELFSNLADDHVLFVFLWITFWYWGMQLMRIHLMKRL